MPSTTGSHGTTRRGSAARAGRRHADVHVQPLDALARTEMPAVADKRKRIALLDDRLCLGTCERMLARRRSRAPPLPPRSRSASKRRSASSISAGSCRCSCSSRKTDGEQLGLHGARQLEPLDSAQDASTAATCSKVDASRIIKLLIDPERETAGSRRNRCSITAEK